MTREWKPGDLAMVTCSDGQERRALFGQFWIDDSGVWVFRDGTRRNADESQARPLVVIDPEDRERVERLTKAIDSAGVFTGLTVGNVSKMQTALREFANPTPPRIDEPGTWGVVEASCVHSSKRREWVKFPSGNWHSIRDFENAREDIENPDDWESLIDPVLVREGLRS